MSQERGYTLSTAEELKNRKITQKSAKKGKLKKAIIALLIAAGLLTGGYYVANNFAPTAIVEQQQYAEGAFDINSEKEIVARGTDLALDLREAGYEIDGEDSLYFMLFAGNDDLKEDFVDELNLSNATERVITDSVDKTLIDVKEAIMGGKEVSIQDYFPDVNDQALLKNLFTIMKNWNQGDKTKVAAAMLELNDYMFLEGNYQEYSPQAVVTYIKLFRGFDELTINSGYTLATEDMRNLIYIDQDCYTKDGDISGRSIHSEQYEVVKEILNEKFNEQDYDKEYEEGLGYKIINQINKNIKESGIALGTPTDVQAERDKNNNTVYADNPASPDYVPPISQSEKEQIKVDPSTGEEYIFQPATEAEKQQQRDEINQQIKEEAQNSPSAEQIQKEWQTGHDIGFTDGIDGKSKQNNSGKGEYYIQGYDYGYNVGYEMYKATLEEDELISEQFVPSTNAGTSTYSTETSTSTGSSENSTSSSSTSSTSESTSFEFVDGFYSQDGVVYDSQGNMLRDENGNPLTIGEPDIGITNQK